MKRSILLFTFLISILGAEAQVPQKMSYQAVVRDLSNGLVANTLISLKVSILSGSPSGPAVYVETHSVTTNANGLMTLQIGGGGIVSGTFVSVNWGAAQHFIKTEADLSGGSNYTVTGTSELLSVPYAFYSGNGVAGPAGPSGPQGTQGPAGPAGAAGTFTVPFSATVNASSALIDITNSGSNGAISGISSSTSNPAIYGKLSGTTGAGFVAAVRGENMATGNNGIGVYGSQAGNGWGVYGIAATGTGVWGETNSGGGTGVQGVAGTGGTAVSGIAGNGGYAGIFQGGNVGIGTSAPNSSKLEVWANSTGTTSAINAISTTAGNPAIDITGPIRVGGLNPAAFIVQGQNTNSAGNGYLSGNVMNIVNPICDNDPNAILLVTHNWSANSNSIYLNQSFGVYYNSANGKWGIYLENSGNNMPQTAFNVLVIKR